MDFSFDDVISITFDQTRGILEGEKASRTCIVERRVGGRIVCEYVNFHAYKPKKDEVMDEEGLLNVVLK